MTARLSTPPGLTMLASAALMAGAGGVAIAGLGVSPAVALLASLGVSVAVFTVLGVSLDRLAFALAAVLVVFLPWNGIRLGGGAFSDGLLVVAFVAVLPLVVQERRRIPLPPWMAIAAAGLVVSALVTFVFPPSLKLVRATLLYQAEQSPLPSVFPSRSDLSALVKFEIAWLVLPMVLAINATSRRRCVRLLDLWTAAAVVSALVALADYAGVFHLATQPLTNHRSSGLTIHANYLAFESALSIPLALLWWERGRRWTFAGLIGTAALLGGVYVSGSRAAAVGALLALALTVVALPRLRRTAGLVVPFAGMVIIALLAFTSAGSEILRQVRLNPNNSSALASNTQRHLAAAVALTQIKARPLEGVGFAVIEDAHDIYLQLLAAGGVIVMAAFALYCGGLMRVARRAFLINHRAEATACVISIIVWLVGGIFDNQLVDKFLYVVPGALLALARIQPSPSYTHQSPPAAVPVPAVQRVATASPELA